MQHITEEVLRDAWSAAWDHGRVAVLDTLMAPGYVRVNSVSGSRAGLERFKSEIQQIRLGFPDLRTTVDSVVIGRDRIAVFWSSQGTHTETFFDVPATGATVRTSGSNLIAVRDGLIASEQVTWDASQLLSCLGIRSLRDAVHDDSQDIVANTIGTAPDPQLLKGFNRQFITGVTVVTTTEPAGAPRGLAVNAYASISLEPPLVLVCVQKTSSTYPSLFRATHLGINVLSTGQAATVASFARSGHDKFAGVAWHAGPDGSPLLDGSSAALEAEILERLQTSTHTMFICRVRHAEVGKDDPMIYRAGKFFHSSDLQDLTA